MFYDLNVNVKIPQSILEDILNELSILGYRGVALTTELDDSVYKKEKSKKKTVSGDGDPMPPPLETRELKEKYPKLKIYKRINVILSSVENIRKVLQSKYIKQYDILSFQPENQQVLKSLAGIHDVDIISYNPESKCTLSLTRKLYNQFVNQNVYFELLYVPGITSQTSRRNLISLSHIYHAVGKSKNVIVSSGTYSPHHIRGPYDVMNFNLLFGLSEEQAKKAISKNCEKLLIRAIRSEEFERAETLPNVVLNVASTYKENIDLAQFNLKKKCTEDNRKYKLTDFKQNNFRKKNLHFYLPVNLTGICKEHIFNKLVNILEKHRRGKGMFEMVATSRKGVEKSKSNKELVEEVNTDKSVEQMQE